MKIKTLLKQNNAVEVVFRDNDKDNNHYQIKGATKDIFYHHHLGRYLGDKRNPDWERVTICVYKKYGCLRYHQKFDEWIIEDITIGRYQYDGIGSVDQADKKLTELITEG